MSGNYLSGDISYYFFNASSLLALDIRNNHFTGSLHWVRSIDNIRILSLGRNRFGREDYSKPVQTRVLEDN